MKTTGYELREALKRWKLKRDVAQAAFPKSLKTFEGQDKRSPEDLASELLVAEAAIAKLQATQDSYNTIVSFEVGGEQMSLCYAIKHLGGLVRVEKLWRDVAVKGEDTRFSYTEPTRLKDHEYARDTVTPESAAQQALEIGKVIADLRVAISKGNAVEVETDCDEALFSE